MSRKRYLAMIALVIVSISLLIAASYYSNYGNALESSVTLPQTNPPETPEGPQLVIPESPLGTLGFVGALAAALAVFVIIKKSTL